MATTTTALATTQRASFVNDLFANFAFKVVDVLNIQLHPVAFTFPGQYRTVTGNYFHVIMT